MTRLLIVDDSRLHRKVLMDALLRVHPEYEIDCAADGRQALERLEESFPDLIMLDLVMPNMDGLEVCREIKSREETRDIPVIVVTSVSSPERKVEGFQSGADDYIVKPINARETVARVEAQLRLKAYRDELKAANEKLTCAQQALVEGARMSAVGSLAAGVAHEFNNIFAAMKSMAQLNLESRSLDDLHRMLESLDQLVDRGATITRSLLTYAFESDERRKRREDVQEALRQSLALAAPRIRDEAVELHADVSDVPPLECYPGQIPQAFLNIVHNALDAMRGSRKRTLDVKLTKCPEQELQCPARKGREHCGEKGCVIARISDTGCGVPEHISESIFDPFVTTKGVIGGGDDTTPGRGLGLAIAYGIVQRHRGSIHFERQVGGGTTFVVRLPLTPPRVRVPDIFSQKHERGKKRKLSVREPS